MRNVRAIHVDLVSNVQFSRILLWNVAIERERQRERVHTLLCERGLGIRIRCGIVSYEGAVPCLVLPILPGTENKCRIVQSWVTLFFG